MMLLVSPVAAGRAMGAAASDDKKPSAQSAGIENRVPDVEKYTLRYKFQPGETLRWNVVHRKRIQATYGGSNQVTESASRSTKCWRVIEVGADGVALIETAVDDVDMRQKINDGKTVRYNSRADKTPPRGFEGAAERIGKPLARVKLDARGSTVEREPLMPEPPSNEKQQLTIPLPKDPVAVGESWNLRHEMLLRLETGATKTILIQQVFTLQDVKTGVATIEVANQVLTPIHSPEIEAKLIERYSHGIVRFDVDAGRILSQQMDLDRNVVGFRGAESCMHYLTRFTEEFLPPTPEVAARP
ncbi:MAG: hypothetical protein JW719_12385 [Pirellulales bacterium]|nr:hypothetical protein [Pirellulales bacterium]